MLLGYIEGDPNGLSWYVAKRLDFAGQKRWIADSECVLASF
jgi:hypothetical protein